MHLSVVIPAYNEEKRIKPTLKKIVSYLEEKKWEYEIIVVDDGSQDQTSEIVNFLSFPKIRLIRHPHNLGKGAAVRTGVLKARFPYILFTDADLSTPISEIEKFLPQINKYDILIGSRALKKSIIIRPQPFFKVWLGRLGNLLIRLFLSLKIQDTQCGFKLYKSEIKEIFKKIKILKWGFDFEVLFLAKKKGLTIQEIPIIWYNNPETKFKAKDYFQTLIDLIKVRLNWLLGKYK